MKLIPIIQKINRIKRDISENQTIVSTILPILRYLGWDIFNENRVVFEDVTTTKKRVDITLVFEDNSKFIIEAKRLSHKLSIKDFEQLTLYINSDDSVNFGILTNGIDYWIADNKAEGLDNKKIYGFNIFEMSECDLSILKLFFSFNASYKLKDINRYIDYIQTGIDFGDKKCEKVLDISNFEADKELKFKTSEELQSEKSSKKPQFDIKKENFDSFLDSEDKNIDKEFQDEVVEIENSRGNLLTLDESTANNLVDNIEENNQKSSQELVAKQEDVEVIKPEESEDEIEFFELIERNRAKIYLNGEYHLITDENFSSLFVQMLRYILHKMESYPALFSKVIDEFDFIVLEDDRNSRSAKYENIGEGLYYNVNITNYIKLKNIESLLKFIHSNFE